MTFYQLTASLSWKIQHFGLDVPQQILGDDLV